MFEGLLGLGDEWPGVLGVGQPGKGVCEQEGGVWVSGVGRVYEIECLPADYTAVGWYVHHYPFLVVCLF